MVERRTVSFDSKTSCFGIVEGLSFTVKYHSFTTKTTCFGVVMLSDTFLGTITLPNKQTMNELEAKVTLLQKYIEKKWKEKDRKIRVLQFLKSLGITKEGTSHE